LIRKSALLAILLLATFLRFCRIDAQSFWNDEGNSARIAERSINLIIEGAAGDIHPPGYYLLLAGWQTLAGRSEFVLRGLSAFAGILLVALIYKLGKHYFNEHAALSAAFIAAIHPALIYYSQEARMYELAAMWGAAAFLVSRKWEVKKRLETGDWRLWLGLALVTAAGLYTHYAFAFVVIASNLYAVIWIGLEFYKNRDRQTTIQQAVFWLSSQALALALFGPWLPITLRQVSSWPAERTFLSSTDAFLGVSNWLAFGPTVETSLATLFLIAVGVALAYALWTRRIQSLALLVWLFVPVIFTLDLGLFSETFAKFLIVAIPPLCLLLAVPLGDALRKRNRLMALAGVAYIVACGVGLQAVYFNPAHARADYRGIARTIDSIAKPGDAILLNAPNQWEVFTYYHTDLSNVFPVARSRPLDVAAQTTELEAIVANHSRLFVVYWGEAQSDPNRVIERWLNEHTFKAYDQWYGDVRVAAYAVPQTASELQTRTDITLGDQVVLEGYSLNSDTFAPGDILQLTLFWKAIEPIETRYKVFVHLISDPSQPPVAQHDGEPGGGLVLTNTWTPNHQVPDNHGIYLPLDLPPGDYSLVIGMYGVDDGVRLTYEGGDAVNLGTVRVETAQP
jgi:mannosyltransferase